MSHTVAKISRPMSEATIQTAVEEILQGGG